jgi:dephospho-CoA kinase
MLSVGITGGMGSGKSLICLIFNLLGISIYNSDLHAKRLMEEDEKVKSEIIKLFGKESYFDNGNLNRKFLAGMIFNNQLLLTKINEIIHPAVRYDAIEWQNKLPSNKVYCIRESAILFETGIYKHLDFNILVTAPENIRKERIKKRDGITEEEIQSRINQQWPENKKLALCDFQIINDGKSFLIPQVLKIHQLLRDYSLKQVDKPSNTIL